MREEQPTPPDPEQVESHARAVMLEAAAELRRIDNRLSDVAAQLSGVIADRDPGQPLALDEALLGAVETGLEHVGPALAVLRGGAEISAERLAGNAEEHRAAERRRAAAALIRIGQTPPRSEP